MLPAGPSPEQVAGALERIFARREFTDREVPALLRALAEVWHAFTRWVGSLIPQIVPERWHPLFTALLAASFALLAVWLLVRVLERRTGMGARSGRVRMQPQSGVDPRDPESWERAARTAAERGRFRDAALALYTAAVLRLDARGVVRFQPGKTPGDYRREARADASTRDAFDAFIRLFLPLAFGSTAPDAVTFAALRGRAAELGVHG